MTAKTLYIKQIRRLPSSGSEDELNFEHGVNVIVGVPNTGKSRWLQMLDYLMGDPDTPESTFSEELAQKYNEIQGIFVIDNKEFLVRRNWNRQGAKSKVFVNNDSFNCSDFQEFLLKELNIPILDFPKGNPSEERNWNRLSWRVLYRHIYRRQRFWGELVDKQPDSEQRASILQFLGLAEYLFSSEYYDLVAKNKEISNLQISKEQFLVVLNKLSNDVFIEEVGANPTLQTINVALQRLRNTIVEIQSSRLDSLNSLITKTLDHQSLGSSNLARIEFERLATNLEELNNNKEGLFKSQSKIIARIKELEQYQTTIENESQKLSRAKNAGRIFADLRVTHCPVCDQPVQQVTEPGHCFLCHQPWIKPTQNSSEADQRISFELAQLEEERTETTSLLTTLKADLENVTLEMRKTEENILRIETLLLPSRQIASAILPPEIAMLDIKIGQTQEKIQQLERLKSTLAYRDELSKKIEDIQKEVAKLDREIRFKSEKTNFEQKSDLLADGMNTYLNLLVVNGKRVWTQDPTLVYLNERNFEIKVGRRTWQSQLGGTLTLYFLLSYHFGLLNLTKKSSCNYPGLTILDFPATLENNETIRDKENYILEPFVGLVESLGINNTQVIAAGAAFEGLEGIHRIELTKVWK